jgi:hypothetical protein
MPAHNERFCEMAAVTPQTILCGFASFAPVRAAVEAPPAPSRQNVVRNQRQRSGQ